MRTGVEGFAGSGMLEAERVQRSCRGGDRRSQDGGCRERLDPAGRSVGLRLNPPLRLKDRPDHGVARIDRNRDGVAVAVVSRGSYCPITRTPGQHPQLLAHVDEGVGRVCRRSSRAFTMVGSNPSGYVARPMSPLHGHGTGPASLAGLNPDGQVLDVIGE